MGFFLLVDFNSFIKSIDESGNVDYFMRIEQDGIDRKIPFERLPEMPTARFLYNNRRSPTTSMEKLLDRDVKRIYNLHMELAKEKAHELQDKVIKVAYVAATIGVALGAVFAFLAIATLPMIGLAIGFIFEMPVLLVISSVALIVKIELIAVVALEIFTTFGCCDSPLETCIYGPWRLIAVLYESVICRCRSVDKYLAPHKIETFNKNIAVREEEIDAHLSELVELFNDEARMKDFRGFFEKLRDNNEGKQTDEFLEKIEKSLSEIDEAEKFYRLEPWTVFGPKVFTLLKNKPQLLDFKVNFI